MNLISSNDLLAHTDVTLRVFPTRTSDFVNLEIYPCDSIRCRIELIGITGLTHYEREMFNQCSVCIDVEQFPAGSYLLKVSDLISDRLLGVEKIIKY